MHGIPGLHVLPPGYGGAVLLIGTLLLLIRKGTPVRIRLGRVYMVLDAVTASITVFMPAEVGLRILNHFGRIHSLDDGAAGRYP